MELDEARRLLGVSSTATRTDLRVAYRRLMRQSHPDVAPHDDTHERAALLTVAYEIATATGAGPSTDGAAPDRGRRSDADRPAADRDDSRPAVREQRVSGTSADAFHPVLLEACSFIGEIVGVDRSDHAVQVRIEAEGYADSCLFVQLDERGADLVAVCSLESFDGGPAPDIADVVADLHRALALVEGA